jgi:uncharacterized protein (DUF697 family)
MLARRWANAGKKVLVFFDQAGLPVIAPSQTASQQLVAPPLPSQTAPPPTPAAVHEAQAAQTAITVPKVSWGRHVIYGSVNDTNFLLNQFALLVIDMLPDRLLSLGRHFPLFRSAIANHLINETCFSNATYSLSTGLAEIVPVFTLPLNLTDTIVLTKSQAFLVYKLGLALGFSTRWQDYVAEFGSVLGAGFVWRQVARSLIGLIPAWGLIPKVGVAYSGTYVVGHVVYQWYLNGRHISRAQMNALYSRAAESGRQLARRLTRRLPRPRLKMPARRKAPKLPPPQSMRSCPNCKRPNNPDASFCQYCGNHF